MSHSEQPQQSDQQQTKLQQLKQEILRLKLINLQQQLRIEAQEELLLLADKRGFNWMQKEKVNRGYKTAFNEIETALDLLANNNSEALNKALTELATKHQAFKSGIN